MKATSGMKPEVKRLNSTLPGDSPSTYRAGSLWWPLWRVSCPGRPRCSWGLLIRVCFQQWQNILWRTRVIEKAGNQVYPGTEMFWCWSPREENEGFSKYINFCWNIFLLANFRHWVIFIATICHNHKHYLAFLFGSTLLGFNTNVSADSSLP